jgi:hypothetical protein
MPIGGSADIEDVFCSTKDSRRANTEDHTGS